MNNNNKRIAKNTLLLYLRMLFTMIVSLYTSRVVLNTLGVEDFGIYNVVGGVVAMFSFLSGSLGGASSRYITYGLGVGNLKHLIKVFSNIVLIHFCLAIIVVLLAETIGLWFLYHKMQIPLSRISAAIWVYQYSVITLFISIMSIPYNAIIIGHERMSAFAYISILDVILKLVVAYILVILPFDKLKIYGGLLCVIQVINQLMYWRYCKIHFKESTFHFVWDKSLFQEIVIYAGWTMNGNLAVIGYVQGLNVLLNLFFSPIVNASRGIAVQVQGVAQKFCNSFQMALNPQLTKSYAQGNLEYMHQLIVSSSKYSFFLVLFISIPIMFEAKYILNLWLGIVPDHTVNFVRLVLMTSILGALANPIKTSIHATGKIKRFQIIEGSLLLSIVPIAYLLLKYFQMKPESVFIVHLIIEIIAQTIRVYIVLPEIKMEYSNYVKNVIRPIMIVLLISPVIPFITYHYLPESLLSFFIVCATCSASTILAIYFAGCTTNERVVAIEKMKKIINRK